jgi:hypothetical protein
MKIWQRKIQSHWDALAKQWLDAGNAADILGPMRIGFYAGAIAAASLVTGGKKIVEAIKPLMEEELGE